VAKIRKIALTGGPCGGKSTAIPILKEFLEAKGWQVYTTPETATLLSAHGIELGSPNLVMRLAVQTAILKLQLALEDGMMAAAQASGKDCVVISDRGLMDTKVYIDQQEWQPHLERHHLSETILRNRYDAVFHMMSAAVGAPKFYNHDNPERWETLEQAIVNDRKTQDAWADHSHLRIIDNSTGFVEKLQRLCKAVQDFI
jgi:thymidylate kinase